MKAKLLLSFSLSVFFSAFIFAQPLIWSGEISVANGSTYGKVRPRIVLTNGNIPLVMWGGGVSNDPLYAARWNGTGFNTPVTITPPNLDPFIDVWAGADMAANGDDVFVVFKAEPAMTENIYVVKSSDGGITWSAPVRADSGATGMTDLPSIAVDAAGNPSVMFMQFDSAMTNPAYVITSSPDGGASFPPANPVSNLAMSEVCDCCPGYLAVKGNYFVAAWRRNNNNQRDMWLGISNDGGISFPNAMDADNTNWMITSCPSSGPSPFITNDSVITAFMSGASGHNRIYISTNDHIGLQTGFSSLVDGAVTSSAIQNYPFLAGADDTVALVYQQAVGGNTDAMYAYSYTGAPGLINNVFVLNNSTTGNQKNPHVAYAAGVFHFVWVDFVTGDVMYKAGNFPNAIEENAVTPSLTVYPNPSNTSVQIDLGEKGDKTLLEVFDVNGRLVESANVGGMKNFTLEKQLPGVYIVKLTGENKAQQIAKLVFY